MNGKVVAITGAGTGFGRSLALRLAADGDHVVVLGRTLARLETVAQAGRERIWPIACDIADSTSVAAAFAAIGERHGRLDALINNAAVFEPFLIEEASDTQIAGGIATNLTGAIYATRAAIPLLRQSQSAVIVSLSSESVEMDWPHLSIYAATKAGLERFMRAMRQELRGDAIRCTSLRVGSMIDPDKQWNIAPAVLQRFMAASVACGIDMANKTSSRHATLGDAVRMVLDLPRDSEIELMSVTGHAHRDD